MKKIFKFIGNFFSVLSLGLLLICTFLLLFYILENKIADFTNNKALFRIYTIISPSMEPELKVYDAVAVMKVNSDDDLKVGDIITFYSDYLVDGEYTVTHRIYEKFNENGKTFYATKGDNNLEIDDGFISLNNIEGKVILKIPNIGKAQYFISSLTGWTLVILIPALIIIIVNLIKIIKLIVLKKNVNNLKMFNNYEKYNEKKENKKVRAIIQNADRINKKK